jgi:histone H3/H4
MKTTLNSLRAYNPCKEGWEKLLRGLGKTEADDEIIWIDQVLDINGLDDALWCLRAVEGYDREIRLFSVWCARRVQHLMDDPRSIAALDVAERYARGEATKKQLASARVAARPVAGSAAQAAVWAAEEAAMAARAAVWAAEEAAWAAAEAARPAVKARDIERAFAERVSFRDIERAAQAEELRRICREMREAKP